jgi:hypothetical protein
MCRRGSKQQASLELATSKKPTYGPRSRGPADFEFAGEF